MIKPSAKRVSNFARNTFIVVVAAGALLLFVSARAQSIALPIAGMVALLLPAPALLLRRWRRPPLYLAAGAVYALLAGIVRSADNDVTTVVSVGFALAALVLLGAAVAISSLQDLTMAEHAKAQTVPTAVDAIVAQAVTARGLRILAGIAFGLATLTALAAALPGSVWGSHAIGQLVALAAHPGLGSWWGALVAIDGIAGGILIFITARRLGASVPAAAIAGLLWAACPAREWPLSLWLAPTFLVPLFCWGMIEEGERDRLAMSLAGAAILVAAVFAPVEAIAMIAIGAAFCISLSHTRARLRRHVIYWAPPGIAALAYVALAPQRVAHAFSASGALLGVPGAVRSLAGDGSLPWEAGVPASMLTQFAGAEHHAGVVLALCISPGIALIAAALAFVILRPAVPNYPIGKVAALSIALSLYAALPSQWAGVTLPTLAAALAALTPGFAGIAQAGLGISVFCALLGALALDKLFVQPSGVWRTAGAAFVGLAIIVSVLPLGPGASRVAVSPTIAAELWAAKNANGGSIAYYPLMDATSPRGAELAYVETISGTRVTDLHLSDRERELLGDFAAPGVASQLRARGVHVVIIEERAYADPLVTPSLSQWVWLPGDLRTARQPMPRVPNEYSPIQAFDDGSIVVYKL
ncbi:MAG TPA: hypothetical protein VII69_13965 [Candidatus Eremiobacteraceae bacterium]